MLKRTALLIGIIAGIAGQARAQDAVPDADVALAARVSSIGIDLLHKRQIDPADLPACAGMLKAAAKLDPSEMRYPRLLAENYLAQNDVDGAIAAIKQYRKCIADYHANEPEDLGAQIELIQLNLSKMETADAKLAYTNQILGADSVNPDVRSAVAVTCAKILYERGQQGEADKMIDNAIRLNALNNEALRIRYANGLTGMSDFQKAQALLAMVKANPLQPQVVAELAERLADFGLVRQSLDWYFDAIKLYQMSQQPIPLDLAIDYGAEQFLAERYDGAGGMAIRLLQSEPNDIDALYLRLLCVRHTTIPGDELRIRNLARRTLLDRLKGVSDFVAGTATTQPTTVPAFALAPTVDPLTGAPATRPVDPAVDFNAAVLPDLSAALAKIDRDKDSREKSLLISAVSDTAWYAIYFDPQPEVAQTMLDVLAKIVPADNVTLVRLQGWNFLAQNKNEEGKVKLSAIADRDAMAALGLVKITPPTDVEANNRGRKLLSENPSRMLGVFIKETLRSRDIKVVASDKAQSLSDQLENFPANWMSVIDKPSDYYLIRGTPLQGQFDFNEPILVNVTIQNTSLYDITVGPDGVLRNDLWIDAQIPVPNVQNFPGTAYDRITKQIVLRARQSMSQVVRVDQGALSKALNDNPTSPQQVWVSVLTNPVSTNEGVAAGPGGNRVQLNKVIARAGFGVGSDAIVDKMLDDLEKGTIGKISKMDLMAAYIRQARANPADERLAKVAPKFQEKLTVVRIDTSASVRGYARYLSATFAEPANKASQVQEMSRSEDWSTRLLAAVAAQSGIDAEAKKAVLTELSNDAEVSVKEYAAATLKVPATTQPTTLPTTRP